MLVSSRATRFIGPILQALAAILLSVSFVGAQSQPGMHTVTATGRVEFTGVKGGGPRNLSNVVVWLTPVPGAAPVADPVSPLAGAGLVHPMFVQKNKSFNPHILVVPVGTVVEFPNRDPFFHNVFSLFEGKRFDLGLYEAGSSRTVEFNRVGISYIFCNIHPEMSAVVVALGTPYHAISDAQGNLAIPNVVPGRYVMHVFYESAPQDALKSLTSEINISSEAASLGVLSIPAASRAPHKNKYGRDYEAPLPDTPPYAHP